MPAGDGAGPMGMGSMTGRGMGLCTGFEAPGYANYTGRHAGIGWRRGLGRRCGYGRIYYGAGIPRRARVDYAQYSGIYDAADEKDFLGRQADFLEDQLKQVKKRLSSMEEETE